MTRSDLLTRGCAAAGGMAFGSRAILRDRLVAGLLAAVCASIISVMDGSPWRKRYRADPTSQGPADRIGQGSAAPLAPRFNASTNARHAVEVQWTVCFVGRSGTAPFKGVDWYSGRSGRRADLSASRNIPAVQPSAQMSRKLTSVNLRVGHPAEPASGASSFACQPNPETLDVWSLGAGGVSKMRGKVMLS